MVRLDTGPIGWLSEEVKMLNTARVNVFETPSLFHQVDSIKAHVAEVALLIQGRVRRLPEGVWLKVGSDRRASIHVDDPHISAKHAVIRRQGHTLEVLDSQSTNGLWWRGDRHEELTLERDDVFFLGALPVLVVQVAFSARFPKAYRWCDMVLMPSSSVLLERIALMASTSDPVMILGESGTGKERVARSIHASSSRAEGITRFKALSLRSLSTSSRPTD